MALRVTEWAGEQSPAFSHSPYQPHTGLATATDTKRSARVIAPLPESRVWPPPAGYPQATLGLSTDTIGNDRGNGVSGERFPMEGELMELSTTTKVTLTETEKEMMIGTCWGAFTRANNAKIGRTLIRLLEQGTQFPNDDYKVTTLVASESRVGEATDTECREAICHFLDSIKLGKFPNLRPDWNK